jgi:hypothetical protein
VETVLSSPSARGHPQQRLWAWLGYREEWADERPNRNVRHDGLSVSAAGPCGDDVGQDVPEPADRGGIMTDTPQLLLADHLKALKGAADGNETDAAWAAPGPLWERDRVAPSLRPDMIFGRYSRPFKGYLPCRKLS